MQCFRVAKNHSHKKASIGGTSCHAQFGTCGYSEENNDKVRDLSLAAAGVGLGSSVKETQSAGVVAHAAACKAIYAICHSAWKHKPTCSEAKTDEELDAAINALLKEIMYRGVYLSMKCVYYLEGSRKTGSAKKEKGHKNSFLKNAELLQIA